MKNTTRLMNLLMAVLILVFDLKGHAGQFLPALSVDAGQEISLPEKTDLDQDSPAAEIPPAIARPKKYKRVLVLTGGGINPGVGVGILSGLEAIGWKPDLVIATCGYSMSAVIYNTFQNGAKAAEYAQGPAFFKTLLQIGIETPSLLRLAAKFKTLKFKELPEYFSNNVLVLPNQIHGFLPTTHFATGPTDTKTLIVASKANFGPKATRTMLPTKDRFTLSYMTDEETAAELRDFKSPIKKAFPNSFFTEDVEIRTDVTTEQASRASVSDPVLINPGKIGDDYYFTGAGDLYPLELAHFLGEEVMSTFPVSFFDQTEDTVIKKTFGYSQNKRMLMSIQDQNVKWIDMTDVWPLKMDPTPTWYLKLQQNVPQEPRAFARGIKKQYDFGYKRGMEAALQTEGKRNFRGHLRTEISTRLVNGINCYNANVWKISGTICVEGRNNPAICDRREAELRNRRCLVLR